MAFSGKALQQRAENKPDRTQNRSPDLKTVLAEIFIGLGDS